MDDQSIVALYWQRNELAIKETATKYGAYCTKISMNILCNLSDSEENVNDTYMQTWKSIPPNRPEKLLAFIAKIARNLALNKYNARHTKKRAEDEFSVSLDELDSCVPTNYSVEDEINSNELSKLISRFLHEQAPDTRKIFVSRYFYCESISDLSNRFGYSESKIKMMLMRTRNRLRIELEKEGYNEK